MKCLGKFEIFYHRSYYHEIIKCMPQQMNGKHGYVYQNISVLPTTGPSVPAEIWEWISTLDMIQWWKMKTVKSAPDSCQVFSVQRQGGHSCFFQETQRNRHLYQSIIQWQTQQQACWTVAGSQKAQTQWSHRIHQLRSRCREKLHRPTCCQ